MTLPDKKNLNDIQMLLREYDSILTEILKLEDKYDKTYPRTMSDELYGMYIRISSDLASIKGYYNDLKIIPYQDIVKDNYKLIKEYGTDAYDMRELKRLSEHEHEVLNHLLKKII